MTPTSSVSYWLQYYPVYMLTIQQRICQTVSKSIESKPKSFSKLPEQSMMLKVFNKCLSKNIFPHMQPMSAILASAEKKQVCPMPQLTNIIYIKKNPARQTFQHDSGKVKDNFNPLQGRRVLLDKGCLMLGLYQQSMSSESDHVLSHTFG